MLGLCTVAFADEATNKFAPLRSSLQPGDKISTIFEPLNINGPNANEPHCLVCENGLSPVVMIVACEVSEPLEKLLAKVDAATVVAEKYELGSFAVVLGSGDEVEARLKRIADDRALKKLVLAIDEPKSLRDYRLADAAEITVLLYVGHIVKANHSFRKGELTDAAVEKLLADLPKILIEKK